MNLELFSLDPLILAQFQVKPVVRSIIHSILFHRALGNVVPLVTECEVFDISYVRINNRSLNRTIEERIEIFYNHLLHSENKKGTISISFFSNRKSTSWFTTKEEKLYWERWIIPIEIYPDSAKISSNERAIMLSTTELKLKDRLFYIIKLVNEKKDHLPSVRNIQNSICYPFEITFPSFTENEDQSWGIGTFKKMLASGPPLLMNN